MFDQLPILKPLLAASALLLFALPRQEPAAPAPAEAPIPAADAARTNPVHPTPDSLAHARRMYGYDCAVCHGATGNGKGEMAADMHLKDFTDPGSLKDRTDGELFYIIKNGRGQMPGEGDRLNTDQIWNMVLYVRGFSKR